MRRLILVITYTLFSIYAYSQRLEHKFVHLTIDDGLSNSTVYAVLQDSKGLIWCGTQDGGLTCYDGYKFKVFINDPKNKNSISSNNINALAEDKQGNIWICTWGGGVNKLDPKTEKFTAYKNKKDEKNCLSSNTIQSIHIAKNGIIWIGTSDGGLNSLNPQTNEIVIYKNNPSNPKSLINNRIWSIDEDSEGNLWLATSGGLDKFDLQKKEFVHFYYRPGNTNGISHNQVRSVLVDNQQNVWVGTAKGIDILKKGATVFEHFKPYPKDTANSQRNNVNVIFQDTLHNIWIGTQQGGATKLNPKTNQVSNFLYDENNPYSLSYDDCRSIIQDKAGTIWLATRGGGLNLTDLRQKRITHYKRDVFKKNTLSNNKIRAILYDKNRDLIWIGTDQGGLNLFNRRTETFTTYSKETSKISSNRVLALGQDDKGGLWIGTNDAGLDYMDANGTFRNYTNNKKDPSSLSDHDVRCIFQDSRKNIWVGTKEGLNLFVPGNKSFIRYQNNPESKNSLTNNRVTCIFESKDGLLWIGTEKGLNMYNIDRHKFISYTHKPEDNSSIPDNTIYSVFQDQSGTIWVGTGNGLSKLLFAKGKVIFKNFGKEAGIRGNAIYGMTEDGHKNLWITTNNGLIKFSTINYSIRIYDKTDGFQSNEFNINVLSKIKNNEILVGGNNGFNLFHTDSIKDNPYIPSILITDFQIFNQSVKPGSQILPNSISYTDEITLSHKDYIFSFEFMAAHYIAPNENRFAYKMEGIDKDWNYTEKHYAMYTTLPPGEYVFRVKGSNSDGIWNEQGATIKIIITPPFYRTNLFYLIAILIVTGLGFVFLQVREHELLKTKRQLEDKVEERTRQIWEQKNEIEQQRDIVTKQNQGITDSIMYASKIQTAVLPPMDMFSDLLTENFIFYKPRDIVSGDFYWLKFIHHKIYFAVADCTGHGVPGAFMSMLGITLLNEIVENIDNKADTAKILTNLRERVISSLHQTGKLSESKDGMDIALCAYDIVNDQLHYSGANNSIFICRRNKDLPFELPSDSPKYQLFSSATHQILEIKADKTPISFAFKGAKEFSNHILAVKPGDTIYLGSDGYVDQFGGPKGRKFLTKRYIELLFDIQENTMRQQRDILEKIHMEWKGNTKQIDDILIMGIRIG
jgi:ligand-binding sensor domain-containing protein/serine phosphatase RsbU (regulator of sigma subunit)